MDRPVPDGAKRVYVVELESGDVVYGTSETVEYVTRLTDSRILVKMTSGNYSVYGSGTSTVLIVKEAGQPWNNC